MPFVSNLQMIKIKNQCQGENKVGIRNQKQSQFLNNMIQDNLETKIQLNNQIDNNLVDCTKKSIKNIYKQDDEEGEDEDQSQNQQLIKENLRITNFQLKRRDKKKKANINGISDAVDIFENILKVDKPKSPFDYQLMLNSFKNHFIIPQSEIEYVIEHMLYFTVPDGQFVFRQGYNASCYFLIERGQCQLFFNGELKKTLINGLAFGELDILDNVPRSASIRAYGDCAFWAIDKTTFRKQQNNRILKIMKKIEYS